MSSFSNIHYHIEQSMGRLPEQREAALNKIKSIGAELKPKGAPLGNRNAAKPPELKRKNITFKLSPNTIKLLRDYSGNKSRLVEQLLNNYFERIEK